MARCCSFNITYDDCNMLSISMLKKYGYLQPNSGQSGVISWSRGGYKTGSIGLKVTMESTGGELEFDYTFNKEPVSYKVRIVTEPSNLGKGVVYYFLCPFTWKRCRKLYLLSKYFMHREAIKSCLYESQKISKKTRQLYFLYDLATCSEKIHSVLYKPYFKPIYNGKPTKKMLKLQKQLDKAKYYKGRIPTEEELLVGLF